MVKMPKTYTETIWDIMKEIEFDDPNFEFLAGLLSYGLVNNGYTEKQIKYIDKYVKKYFYIWDTFDASSAIYVEEGKKNVCN